jgi:hypothetical protein
MVGPSLGKQRTVMLTHNRGDLIRWVADPCRVEFIVLHGEHEYTFSSEFRGSRCDRIRIHR